MEDNRAVEKLAPERSGMNSASERNQNDSLLSKIGAAVTKHHFWFVLAYLILLEVVVFAPVVGKVGFYLDDWGMVSGLFFAPGDAAAKMAHFFFNDSKTIIRPVEVLHFGTLFALAGTKPAMYHIFNGILEVVSAWLLYVAFYRCYQNKVIGVIASALFLLSPVHDCTHYWVLASSATLSMVCWLGSLVCTIEAEQRNRTSLHWLSFGLFAFSLFNYECFLPLCALNVVYGWWNRGSFKHAVSLASGYAGAIALYCLWVRVIVPKIGVGYIHAIHFSAETMIKTVMTGIAVSLPLEQASFYAEQTKNAFDTTALVPCLVLFAATALVVLLLGRGDNKLSPKQLVQLALVSFALIPISYSVFGLNPEYTPTLLTIINRINYGASLGTCLLYALVLVGIGQTISATKANSKLTSVCAVIAAGLLLSVFALADRAMSKPWQLSWVMQKHVASLLQAHRDECTSASAVMLVNSPRYVMWAPVFDGVWDFQNLARVSLNKGDLNAGVVSERLQVTGDSAADISSDFLCGTYPFKEMVAVVAPQSLIVPIDSADSFISCVQQHGYGFGLDHAMPTKWKQQLAGADRQRKAY